MGLPAGAVAAVPACFAPGAAFGDVCPWTNVTGKLPNSVMAMIVTIDFMMVLSLSVLVKREASGDAYVSGASDVKASFAALFR